MIYYVYRLTCRHADSPATYYYGSRGTAATDPRTDAYWSSSRLVRTTIARTGVAAWQKKIIATYATRAEALRHESRLHARFDVATHPLFFNQQNQRTQQHRRPGPLSAVHRTTHNHALSRA